MKNAILIVPILLICMMPLQNAWAKTDLGFNRVGVDAGLVDPEGPGSTVGFGAYADLGTLAPDVRLSSQLGYWSDTANEFGTKATLRDITMGARAVYLFHMTSPKFQPFAGGGLSLHFFHEKVTIPAQDLGGGVIIPAMSASDSVTKLGLDLGGGASTPLSPKANLYGEFWYTAADIDQISMKAGVSFQLSK